MGFLTLKAFGILVERVLARAQLMTRLMLLATIARERSSTLPGAPAQASDTGAAAGVGAGFGAGAGAVTSCGRPSVRASEQVSALGDITDDGDETARGARDKSVGACVWGRQSCRGACR